MGRLQVASLVLRRLLDTPDGDRSSLRAAFDGPGPHRHRGQDHNCVEVMNVGVGRTGAIFRSTKQLSMVQGVMQYRHPPLTGWVRDRSTVPK